MKIQNKLRDIKMNRKNKNRNSGFAMAMVLSVIVLLLLLGGSLLGLSQNAEIASIRRSQEIAAKCAADAGMTKVMSDLKTAYETGTLDLNNLPSEFAVDIENFDANFGYIVYLDSTGNIMIDSTGSAGPSDKTVHCRVDVYSSRFEYTLFADNFDIQNNAYIDGYNSDFGPYGGINVCSISIGTNNTENNAIELDNNGYINGDIFVGPGSDPSKVINGGKHFDVTGEISAAEEEKNTPIVAPPSLDYKGSSPSGTVTENGRYSEIVMGNGETVTIDGEITLRIEGNVELDNNAEIEITEGSSLTLFIDGTFKMSNGGKINNITQKPPHCIIFSTATSEVEYCFDNIGVFYGALYAPNAKVEIKNNAIIYGAILGKELQIDNSTEIYGDKALLNLKGTFNDPDTTLVKGKWWE
ncbi:MAG: hypothetical protein K9M75_06165 [Phycisphaerae bacterium]|nr:hypothetical protein [Phycisphaerae bacterium]